MSKFSIKGRLVSSDTRGQALSTHAGVSELLREGWDPDLGPKTLKWGCGVSELGRRSTCLEVRSPGGDTG